MSLPLHLVRRRFSWIRVGLNPVTVVLVWRGEGRGQVKLEAEVGMVWPQPSVHWGLPRATRRWRRQGRIVPYSSQRDHDPADALTLDL